METAAVAEAESMRQVYTRLKPEKQALTKEFLALLGRRNPQETMAYLTSNRGACELFLFVLATEIKAKAQRVAVLIAARSRRRLGAVRDGLYFATLALMRILIAEKQAHQARCREKVVYYLYDVVRALASVSKPFITSIIAYLSAHSILHENVLVLARSLLVQSYVYAFPAAAAAAASASANVWDFDVLSPGFSFGDYSQEYPPSRPLLCDVFPVSLSSGQAPPQQQHQQQQQQAMASPTMPPTPTTATATPRSDPASPMFHRTKCLAYVNEAKYKSLIDLTLSVRKVMRSYIPYANSWGQTPRDAGFKRFWTDFLEHGRCDITFPGNPPPKKPKVLAIKPKKRKVSSSVGDSSKTEITGCADVHEKPPVGGEEESIFTPNENTGDHEISSDSDSEHNNKSRNGNKNNNNRSKSKSKSKSDNKKHKSSKSISKRRHRSNHSHHSHSQQHHHHYHNNHNNNNNHHHHHHYHRHSRSRSDSYD